ncbi:MAG: TonB-dependent receptor [Proteiniphilum sp.]|uniref:TonB-dependent receptor n=1 Tax=Proteiniphilum sp. TaxID=1926877 RepID=UPI002ABAD16E|nr:TonB-dependent receptor [Proteiniphilum sp.]MDY9918644.1 TonB-dependent receptor [Proteiniphilum sp.]
MNRSVFFIVSLCLVSSMIRASEPFIDKDSIPTYSIGEIEIVAFKANKDLAIQPVSATTLTKEVLKNHNFMTIKEISAFVPNFFMPDYGSRLTSPIYIRGIGSRINAPSVGLYVDGIPYFDRSSYDFNITDIEKIEVLRGSQGTIYGRNTMGGIINVYTKSPFQHRETTVGATAGNYNHYKAEGSQVGQINHALGYIVSANYTHRGGYFNNLYTGNKADGSDALAGRVRLGWQINQRLVAYLTTAYEYSDQDGYPYGLYDTESNKAEAVNYNERSYYRRQMSNNGLHLKYTTADYQLDSQSSFQYFDGKQGIDQDFTPADHYYVTFSHQQQMVSQEINARSLKETPYQWQTGLFGFYQHYGQNNNIEYRQSGNGMVTDTKNPSSGIAVYHQSTFNDLLTDGLSVTLGLRYDWEKIKMENRTKTVGSAGQILDPIYKKDTYSRLTPKFSIQYLTDKNHLTYFSVSQGYKAGGFNTTVDREEDWTFKPEYSWTYEIGWKGSAFENRLHTEIGLFYIDWRDQQVTQKKATEQGFKLRNAGKSVSKGIEITSHIRPVDHLRFLLSYGYTHARFREYLYDESKDIDYGGNFLPLVPRNTFSAAGDYTLNIKGRHLESIGFNMEYTGIGKLFWSENNVAEQPYYHTLNGKISFRHKRMTLSLWAKNITNDSYIAYYFESMGNEFAQQGKPFTIGTDIQLTF